MLGSIAADPKCSNENIQVVAILTKVINFHNVLDIVSIVYPIK